MKVLITGGAGFIGQWTARRLSRWDAVALDILSEQVHQDPEVSARAFPGEVVRGDVTDECAWRRVSRPDLVIHLAAETGTAQSMYEAERYRRTNIGGTRLAAEMAAAWEVPLIAMSSRAVYGEGRYRHADGSVSFGATDDPEAVPEASRETDEHRPVSVYGGTKSEGEALLAEYARRIPVTVGPATERSRAGASAPQSLHGGAGGIPGADA